MVMVSNADMSSGNTLSLGVDPQTGKLSLSVSGLQDDTISLAFARIEGSDIQIFASDNVQIGAGGGSINLSTWDGQNLLSIEIDIDGDGIVDEITELTDQALGELVEDGQTAEVIISEFSEFAPLFERCREPGFC